MISTGISLPNTLAFCDYAETEMIREDCAEQQPDGPPPFELSDRESCADLLLDACRRHPQQIAFCAGRDSLSYQMLEQHSQALAAYLACEMQLHVGEHIALLQPNDIALPVTTFAAWRAGLVATPLSTELTARELIAQLQASGARTIVVHERQLKLLEKIIYDTSINQVIVVHNSDLRSGLNARTRRTLRRLVLDRRDRRQLPQAIELRTALTRGAHLDWRPPLLHGDHLALLQFTSGVSGTEKAVMLSHRNLIASARQFAHRLHHSPRLRGADCLLPRGPLRAPEIPCGWLATMLRGGRTVFAGDNPQALRRSLSKQRCHLLLATTACYRELLAQKLSQRDLGPLEMCINFGATLDQELHEAWRESYDIPLLNAYTSTECTGIVSLQSESPDDLEGSLGRPLEAIDISVRSELGDPMPPGSAGELWIRGPQVFHGYWGNRAESGRALCGDNWLRTGDLVRLGSDGSLDWLARAHDVLTSHHGEAYPDEVESVLCQHPAVRQAACIRCELTNSLCAFRAVVVTEGDQLLSEHELIDWCRERLPAFAVPVSVSLRTFLPRSPSGDILRQSMLEPSHT